MERSGAALLIALICVWFSRISGAEVERRVRPGDDVFLHCDHLIPAQSSVAWFRNCSHENQPPFVITYSEILKEKFPRFVFVKNDSSGSYDLLVKNISENDLGRYYCAQHDTEVSGDGRGLGRRTVYHYGSLTTRLSLTETVSPCVTASTISPSTPPVSDCSVCWKLLVSVCPVCVFLSSVVSSTCVYCFYRNRAEGGEQHGRLKTTAPEEVGGDEVCYASLDLPSRGQKPLKKKKKRRVESSEFSTYSEVKTGRT